MPKRFISLDVECDFKRRLLNIGWCSSNIHDPGKEFFIWQNEKILWYPSEEDCPDLKKYIGILDIWRKEEKTPIGVVLEQLMKDTQNKVITGWNIQCYDIPILAKYVKKYLRINWTPEIFDGLIVMRKLIKKYPKLCEKLINFNGLTPSGKFPVLKAEAMFKYLTGCMGYQEYHTALFDAQDERLIILQMAKIGVSPYKHSWEFTPSENLQEQLNAIDLSLSS